MLVSTKEQRMVGRPFPPGVSGNPSGRPKKKDWTDAIRKAVQAVPEDDPQKRQRLELLAEALMLKALSGDVPALKEVGERLDGKVPQALVGDDESAPITVVNKVVREIVRPKPKN
jgi:hypothetical protein